MAQHQIVRLRAEQAGGADVALFADLQNLPAHQAGRGRPAEQHHRHHHRKDAVVARLHVEEDAEQDHEQQEGQRHHEVREAHQGLVDATAHEAGDAAVENSQQHEGERGDDADEERNPGAVHEPGEHVAAKVVGAQGVQRQFQHRAGFGLVDAFHEPFLHRFLGSDDPRDGNGERRVVGGFLAFAVQGDDGVEIGERLEIEAVLETHVGGIQHVRNRQAKRAVRRWIEDAAVDAIAGRARHRRPVQTHRAGRRPTFHRKRFRCAEGAAGGRCGPGRNAFPRRAFFHHRDCPPGARRNADLIQVRHRGINPPQQRPGEGEDEQGDHQIQRKQRPLVGLQANPGVLPIGKGRARDGLHLPRRLNRLEGKRRRHAVHSKRTRGSTKP